MANDAKSPEPQRDEPQREQWREPTPVGSDEQGSSEITEFESGASVSPRPPKKVRGEEDEDPDYDPNEARAPRASRGEPQGSPGQDTTTPRVEVVTTSLVVQVNVNTQRLIQVLVSSTGSNGAHAFGVS